MSKETMPYTSADVGCWIDGAYGFDHAVSRMEEMTHGLAGASPAPEYHPEDGLQWRSEWLDEMTALLQDNTEDGLVWIWDAGDLVLTTEEEASE